MKCTDYNKLYQKIEALEYQELAAAVKAHGGEYIFFDCSQEDVEEVWSDLDNHDDLPQITGGNKWSDCNSDFYITRVKVDKYGSPVIYGFRAEYGCPEDEDVLSYIEYSYIGCITELIPETDEVTDVSIPGVSLNVNES